MFADRSNLKRPSHSASRKFDVFFDV